MDEPLDYGHYYRQWHDESDAHLDEVSAALYSQLEPYLPADRDSPALDIGCGMGFAMTALIRAGFKSVKGVDIDASQVAACQRRDLDVVQIDDLVGFLGDRQRSFGLVLMLDVLEHIPVAMQVTTLRAVHAALAPGGRLILKVPNASSILASRWLYQDFTHASSFTEQSILFALKNAHFSSISVPPLENPGFRPSFRPRNLLAKKNRWFFKRWIVRGFWKMVLEAELPREDTSRIPLSLNLMAIADKDG